MTPRARTLAPAALAMAFAGCGGGGGKDSSSSGPKADTARADTAAVRTIRGWVDAERRNRPAGAASFFSLPAIVVNGPDPLLLRTRAAARLWHETLPCGAVLLRAVDVRGWTVVRFRLTERPGGKCDGTGSTASTAFAMRDGKIAYWVRVPDDVSPEKAAPPRRPDREFLLRRRIHGRPVPTPDLPQAQGQSA